jgi:hypothetical protein
MTPDARAYLTGRATGGAHPAAVGDKFTASGAARPWPGNTFVCHIPQGRAHQALTTAQNRLKAGPLADAFTFLPPSSFHMTVFEGANGVRRHDDSWPAALPPETDLAEVTARFESTTKALRLPVRFDIRPTSLFGGFSVQVTGATEADEAALRGARSALSLATTILRKDFASYGFHITLAYLMRWLTEAEADRVIALSDSVFADLAAAMPTVTIGPVEFCTFDDMHAFPLIAKLTHAPD